MRARPAGVCMKEFDWSVYYAGTSRTKAHDTVQQAVAAHIGERLCAVDLGCGQGADSKYLLAEGWPQVLAMDATDEVRAHFAADPVLAQAMKQGQLEVQICRFEDFVWPQQSVDLVNASLSLPFCAPDKFAAVWAAIGAHIKEGGVFAGHLFGPRDSWAQRLGMTFHTEAAVHALFDGWKSLELREQEDDRPSVGGPMKHWHIWHIVAQR
jgi:tellurite methyltransferase